MNNEISSKSFSSVTASLAAIPDTPIVSIAGSTLSEITTTTTSTTTTPTPTPIPSEPSVKADISSLNPMSDVAVVNTAGASGATAANINIAPTSTSVPSAGNVNTNTNTTVNTLKKESISETLTQIQSGGSINDDIANETKPKESESWEESRIKDMDDNCLKHLLDEAISYKNPGDKKNKSEIFLQLLQKAENEKDQTYSAITPRFTRNSSSSTTSNSHHNHHNHRKQGGSLQDLVDAVRNESLLDCDFNFGVGGQRNRRNNHNSRQKKYSSVSSRQREGGSLPSNVNVTTNSIALLGTHDQPLIIPDVKAIGNKIQRRNAKVAAATAVAASLVKETDKDLASGIGSGGCGIVSSGISSVETSTKTNVNDFLDVFNSRDFVINIDEPMMDIQQKQQILQSKGQDAATQGMPYYDRLDKMETHISRANVISAIHSKVDFAPTTSQCYVDETLHFRTLETDCKNMTHLNSNCVSNPPTATVTLCGNKGGQSMTLDSKYIPLDENYKSCKSVLGENSDMVKTPTLYPATKTITRQFDENGNSLNEKYHSSVQAAAATMNVSTGTGMHISSSSSINVSTGQSQAKAKTKKKTQQERNTKTIDVVSLAGYRGEDPLETLVRYIENSEEKQNDSKNNNSKFNENNKKKDKKKDKEKQHKMKKSNSLEELRSCAKIDVDDLKQTAATTESNVMMRNKSGSNATNGNNNVGNNNNNRNNSSSAADINKNFASGRDLTITATTSSNKSSGSPTVTSSTLITNRKSERRSWGTEELQFLGENNGTGNININPDDKMKDKRTNNKNKEKDRDKEVEKENVRDFKDQKNDKNTNVSDIPGPITAIKNDKLEKLEKLEKPEKFEKSEKQEKRKKSEPNTGIQTTVDILSSLDSVMPETAEFHVVTKKKKPKKQRTMDDTFTSSGNNGMNMANFNRTHNFMTNMQKSASMSATSGNGSSQQQIRHKYNNLHSAGVMATTPTGNNEKNDNGNIGNTNNHNNSNNHHEQKHSVNSDKSRRKSTSSMPPSEKSDSSDLDSVHSLPIEATTTKNTTQRHKNTAPPSATTTTTTSATSSNSTPNNNKNIATNVPAPISYADIARTNKELAAAAAAASIATSNASDKWPTVDAANNNNNNNNVGNDSSSISTTAVTGNSDETAITTGMNQSQQNFTVNINTGNHSKLKVKKMTSKSDFPELVSTTTVTSAAAATATVIQSDSAIGVKANPYKTISYSQSLTTTVPASIQVSLSNDTIISSGIALTPTSSGNVTNNGNDTKEYKNHERKNTTTTTDGNNIVNVARQQQQLQQYAQQQQLSQYHQQQQPLQKSKSVENESYNYNSSNMDQQYPALEKTVKRYSSTNVSNANGSITSTTPVATANITSPPSLAGGQFNFAAAAKLQLQTANNIDAVQQKSNIIPVTVTTSIINNTATSAITSGNVTNNATTSCNTNSYAANKKSKEKSPTTPNIIATTTTLTSSVIISTTTPQPLQIAGIGTDNSLQTQKQNKSKKDRQYQSQQQQQQQSLYATNIDNETTSVAAQKSSTATQTNSTKMGNKNIAPVVMMPTTKVTTSNKTHKMNIGATAASTAVHSNSNRKNTITPTTTTTVASPGSNSATVLSGGSGGVACRPAVIILNDDREAGVSNEFTFGDFNEDEMKFFDDDIIDEESIVYEDNNTINENEQQYQDYNQHITVSCNEQSNSIIGQATPETTTIQTSKFSPIDGTTTITYFNDSGASSDVVNNSIQHTDDVILISSVDATSSPNASFGNNLGICTSGGNGGNGGIGSSVNNNGCNQSSDSGIYTSNSSNNSNININKVKISTNPTNTNKRKDSSNNKLNNFLNTPAFGQGGVVDELSAISYGNVGSAAMALQPQQLETCNDIETAIIAAARAARNQQQQQQHPQYHNYSHQQQQQQLQQQPQYSQQHHSQQYQHQQQYQISMSSSNSSSFSSTSSVSLETKYPQSINTNNNTNFYNNNNTNSSSNNNNNAMYVPPPSYNRYQQQHQQHSHHPHNYHQHHHQYQQQQQQQQQQQYEEEDEEDDYNDDTDDIDRHIRSRSNSDQYRYNSNSSLVVNIQRKDFDIQFIPPTVSTTISSLQHNEIYVDFIGSAWEEVANSKVTKIYDGQ